MKTLRIMLAAQPKVESLVGATRFEAVLGKTKGVLSWSKAGEHTAATGQLFFYVTVEDDALRAVTDDATDVGAHVDEIDAIPRIDECLNCGNVADKPLSVCPNCQFREIAPCPHCGTDIARVAYGEIADNLFACPNCHTRVRLVYADPLWNEHGKYNEPPVLVREAD